jgi:catalase-peroxidase
MGLIYVNPEGVERQARPAEDAHDVRVTFARMAMNDEETVRADRRRPHRRQVPRQWRCQPARPAPEGAPIEEQGFGWMNHTTRGIGRDTVTSGSKAPGPPTRRSGTTATSGCCSATTGN